MQQAAALEAARHEADAKERLDSAAGKAKGQAEAAQIALVGDKFAADVRAARIASLGGNDPIFLTPSAPDLAQAMQAVGTPTRTAGPSRIGGTAAIIGAWFPSVSCLGGCATGGAAGQAGRAQSQTPAGRRRKPPTNKN